MEDCLELIFLIIVIAVAVAIAIAIAPFILSIIGIVIIAFLLFLAWGKYLNYREKNITTSSSDASKNQK
ncbi:MAG: hypothetical protein ABH826_01905 [Patescibacteria group bacterium]